MLYYVHMGNLPHRGNILILDLGTSAAKAFVFDPDLRVLSRMRLPVGRRSPRRGFVEQDPLELVSASRRALRLAVRKSGMPLRSFAGLGLTNQRETAVFWDKSTGKPVYPAIVWEDSRTQAYCDKLSARPALRRMIRGKTGLEPNPYFSAPKAKWVMDRVPAARRLAEEGSLLFGTVDSWLMWSMLEGRPHLTDATNASRTLLFNVRDLNWDLELVDLFGLADLELPEVRPSASRFGVLRREILGAPLPLLSVCGDQQASLFAAGLAKGTVKITYGTGAFVSYVLGGKFSLRPLFFTTLAPFAATPRTGLAPLPRRPVYALEAKVGSCGKRVEAALGDGAKMAKTVGEIVRQTARLVRRMPGRPRRIVIDGGVTQYRPLAEMLRQAAGGPVKRQKIYDGTALGAAMLARRAPA